MLDVLARCAGGRPRLVVDLGSGTGLSSRAWAARADGWSGVEANPAMLARARAATAAANVTFVEGYADATGLEAGSADIVTCAQSFHWMDPAAVLPEVARVLRPGGVFGAYDYDVVPVIEPQVDAAFAAVIDVRWAARERLGIHAGASHVAEARARGPAARERAVRIRARGALPRRDDGRRGSGDRPRALAGRPDRDLRRPRAGAGRDDGRADAQRPGSGCPSPGRC